MLKSLPLTLLGLLLSCAVSAQCDLTAEATDFTCDPASGGYTFNLLVTGSDSTVRFPAIGLELPLPVNEYFFVPTLTDEFTLELESGTAPDICGTSVLITPPDGCDNGNNNCFVHIEPENLDCGVPGQLTAVATGTAPFSYAWNTGDTTNTIAFGESFFDYAVTVTDADGCSTQTSRFFGDAHPFYIHVESSGNPCIAGQEPSITAATFGGEGPYAYQWSNGDTTATITDVVPEVLYTVTVTDAAGCTGTAQALYHPGALAEQLQIEGPNSTNCDGSPITLSIVNPNPDYDYIWTNGTDTLFGATVTTSTGGYYDVTGFDPANPACQALGDFTVAEINLSLDEIAVVSLGPPCEESVCLALVNTNIESFYILDQVSVTWSSPDTVFTSSEFALLCLDAPASYTATLASACDTVSLSFEIEAEPVCTQVCGTLILDMDQDCSPDPEPHNWSQTIVLLTNMATNITYPVHPNPDGTFCAELPKGGYTITTLSGEMSISTQCDQARNEMEVLLDNAEPMDLFASAAVIADSGDETTSLTNTPDATFSLSAYPNPSSGSLWFDFSDRRIAATDVVTLYDGLGRRVARNTVGALPQPWLPTDITPGVYQIILTSQAGTLKARTSVVFR